MISETTRDAYAALAERIRSTEPAGRWLVLTHDNPDPDALASAHILAQILRRSFRQKVTAAYGGIIGRAENREMVRSLRLPFSHVRHLNLGKYAHFALVDTQPRTGNNQLPKDVVPDLVIDHHPLRKPTTASPCYDVRPRYGATVTILAEYLLASGLQLTHAAATALIYALRAETRDFAREYVSHDKSIYDLFFPRADHRLLARIQSPRLPVGYFSNLHEALENLEELDTLISSHLGIVDQPDIVPEIADLLLRLEGKTWSLATGIYQDRIYLSIRTTNPRADAGALMRRILGRRGKGGGHGMIAGGWVDATKVAAGDRRPLQKDLAARLARELKKNPDKISRLLLPDHRRTPPSGGPAVSAAGAPAQAQVSKRSL